MKWRGLEKKLRELNLNAIKNAARTVHNIDSHGMYVGLMYILSVQKIAETAFWAGTVSNYKKASNCLPK